MPDDILTNLKNHSFYHGTTLEEAELIAQKGFQVWTTFDYDFGDGMQTHRVPSSGNLGDGIYLTCNWRIALWFGSTLLQATLQPGTRILDASIPPDPQTLNYLQREFGRAIIKESPFKTIPHNKQLKLNELIALFRFHYQKSWQGHFGIKEWSHSKHLASFRSILIRYGFHGYGNPADDNGIVIFTHDRIQLNEVIADLPETRHVDYLTDKSCQFKSLAEISTHFQTHGSKRAQKLAQSVAAAR